MIAGYLTWRIYGWWRDNDRRSLASFERAAIAQDPSLAYPQQYPQQPYPQQQPRGRAPQYAPGGGQYVYTNAA